MITCRFEDGGDAALRHVVTDVLVVENDKILLVKRSEGLLEGGKWGFPGGYLDREENLREGALRELKEETGYSGEIIGLFRIISSPNRRNESGRQNVAHVMLAKIGKKVGESDAEQTEVKFWEINDLTEDMMAFDHYETVQILKKYLKGEVTVPIVEG